MFDGMAGLPPVHEGEPIATFLEYEMKCSPHIVLEIKWQERAD